jgi:hypothetical protein
MQASPPGYVPAKSVCRKSSLKQRVRDAFFLMPALCGMSAKFHMTFCCS